MNTRAKTSWDNYYIANALLFLRAVDEIFERIPQLPKTAPDIFWGNVHGILQKLLLESVVLIDDWATFSQHVPGVIGVGKNRFENTMALYHSARQIIYGNLQPFAFSDNHADTAISQFRMAIELRLRDGFGILARLDKHDAAVRLPLSMIIEAINEHKPDIDFAVPFEHIERFYGWANVYMHTGFKQYTWCLIFALTYLRAFLLEKKGIATTLGAIRRVQNSVEGRIGRPTYKLMVSDPRDWMVTIKPTR